MCVCVGDCFSVLLLLLCAFLPEKRNDKKKTKVERTNFKAAWKPKQRRTLRGRLWEEGSLLAIPLGDFGFRLKCEYRIGL